MQIITFCSVSSWKPQPFLSSASDSFFSTIFLSLSFFYLKRPSASSSHLFIQFSLPLDLGPRLPNGLWEFNCHLKIDCSSLLLHTQTCIDAYTSQKRTLYEAICLYLQFSPREKNDEGWSRTFALLRYRCLAAYSHWRRWLWFLLRTTPRLSYLTALCWIEPYRKYLLFDRRPDNPKLKELCGNICS